MSNSRSSACPAKEAKTSPSLDRYRAKSAAMVHKAVGDPEEVAKDGLDVFDALSPARERANRTALKDE